MVKWKTCIQSFIQHEKHRVCKFLCTMWGSAYCRHTNSQIFKHYLKITLQQKLLLTFALSRNDELTYRQHWHLVLSHLINFPGLSLSAPNGNKKPNSGDGIRSKLGGSEAEAAHMGLCPLSQGREADKNLAPGGSMQNVLTYCVITSYWARCAPHLEKIELELVSYCRWYSPSTPSETILWLLTCWSEGGVTNRNKSPGEGAQWYSRDPTPLKPLRVSLLSNK